MKKKYIASQLGLNTQHVTSLENIASHFTVYTITNTHQFI